MDESANPIGDMATTNNGLDDLIRNQTAKLQYYCLGPT